MIRRLYTLMLYLLLPAASLVVLVRGVRQRAYWQGWSERFGFGPPAAPGGIWFHAVSVGEVQAAAILIAAWRARGPTTPITLTCATPTGRARARESLSDVDVRYAPYDLPGCLRRTLGRVRPRLLVVLETELWPNLLEMTRRAGVPTLIASARVSARTTARFARIPGLLGPAMRSNVWVGAQSADDAGRFAALGVPAERRQVVGNVKFDRRSAEERERGGALRERYAGGRPVWVAGSTQPGEEAIVLAAQRLLRGRVPVPLLILAPRHPPRFAAVAGLLEADGLAFVRRSFGTSPASGEVLLLDTLGELTHFYAAADVAFVGGSLVPVGGHNLLEPAALGVPVLAGPYQHNSPDVARQLLAAGALRIVHDAVELAAAVGALLDDPAQRRASGAAGQAVIAANRGAVDRLIGLGTALLAAR